MGLGDAVEAFLLSCRVKGCTNLTLRTYQEALRRFEAQVGEDLTSLTLPSIQRYFAILQSQGLRQVTIHKHYRAVRRFFAWCVEAQLLTSHPLQRFQMKRPQTFPHVPTDDDVNGLLKACKHDTDGTKGRALVLLFADTGLRVTEALKLHVEDLNLGLRS